MRRAVLTTLLTVACGLAVPAVTQGAADANTSHGLGLTSFRDIVVDEPHGHVFISYGGAGVIVTDLSGASVGKIQNLPGADGMTLSDDGSQLFVALSESDQVAAVDAADPLGATAVTTYTVQQNACPTDVASSSGVLWVASSCDRVTADLYALDPADGSSHKQNGVTLEDAVLSASPHLPDTLFVGDDGSSPKPLEEFTTTGGQSPVATLTHTKADAQSTALAVNTAGTRLVTGAAQMLSTSDLSRTRTFRTPTSTDAVAQRDADGLIAFGGTQGPILYKPGATTPYRVYHLGASSMVELRGLAFGHKKLYAVTTDASSTNIRLHVITPLRQTTAHVTTSKRHYAYGKRARVTATVARKNRHAKVSIYSTHVGRKRHLVKTGTVNRKGHFSVRVRVTERTVFSAVVHDNKRFDGITKKAHPVTVAARVKTRFLKAAGHAGRYALFHPSQNAYLLGKVLPDHSSDCLTFHVQFHARGHWGYDGFTGCVSLRVHSAAIGYVQGDTRLVGIPIRMRAEWAGDVRNTRKNSRWRYCKFVHGSSRTASRLAVPEPLTPYAAGAGAPAL